MAKLNCPKCPDFDGFAMCTSQPLSKVASYEWCRKYLEGFHLHVKTDIILYLSQDQCRMRTQQLIYLMSLRKIKWILKRLWLVQILIRQIMKQLFIMGFLIGIFQCYLLTSHLKSIFKSILMNSRLKSLKHFLHQVQLGNQRVHQ